MRTVLAILNRSLPLSARFEFTIHNSPFPALTIQSNGSGPHGLPAIAVCQYRACGAQQLRHPEMLFEVELRSGSGVDLLPFCWRSDYDQLEEYSIFCEGFEPDGRRVLRVDQRRLDDQRCVARDWDKLLAAQSFEVAYCRQWRVPPLAHPAYA